jgi:hypothetical protein
MPSTAVLTGPQRTPTDNAIGPRPAPLLTSDQFQTPSTAARFGSRLAVVNAKFDTGFPPTADQYEVVLVDA